MGLEHFPKDCMQNGCMQKLKNSKTVVLRKSLLLLKKVRISQKSVFFFCCIYRNIQQLLARFA
jgi:hypothetical protein